MGDIRNKLAKIEGRRRDKAALASALRPYAETDAPARPSIHGTQPSTCLCGHAPGQADIVTVDTGEWPRRVALYCHACVPAEHRADLERAIALRG